MDRQTLFSLIIGFLFIFLFFRLINSPSATVNETIIGNSVEFPVNSTKEVYEEEFTDVQVQRVDIPEPRGVREVLNNAGTEQIETEEKSLNLKTILKNKRESKKLLLGSEQLGKLKFKINVNINGKATKKAPKKTVAKNLSNKLSLKESKKRIKENEQLIKIFGAIDNGIFLKAEKEEALKYTFEATKMFKSGWDLENDNLTYCFLLLSYATAFEHRRIFLNDMKNETIPLEIGLTPLARGIRAFEDARSNLEIQKNLFFQIYLDAVNDFKELMKLTNRDTMDFDEALQFWQYFYASLLPTIFEVTQDEMLEQDYTRYVEKMQNDYENFFTTWKQSEGSSEYTKLIDFFLSLTEVGTNNLREKINLSKMNSGDTLVLLESRLLEWTLSEVFINTTTLKPEYNTKDFNISFLLMDLSRSTFLAHEALFDFKWKTLDQNLKIYFFSDLIDKIYKFTNNIPRIEDLKKRLAQIIKRNEKRPRVDYIDWLVMFQILIDLIYEKL